MIPFSNMPGIQSHGRSTCLGYKDCTNPHISFSLRSPWVASFTILHGIQVYHSAVDTPSTSKNPFKIPGVFFCFAKRDGSGMRKSTIFFKPDVWMVMVMVLLLFAMTSGLDHWKKLWSKAVFHLFWSLFVKLHWRPWFGEWCGHESCMHCIWSIQWWNAIDMDDMQLLWHHLE